MVVVINVVEIAVVLVLVAVMAVVVVYVVVRLCFTCVSAVPRPRPSSDSLHQSTRSSPVDVGNGGPQVIDPHTQLHGKH